MGLILLFFSSPFQSFLKVLGRILCGLKSDDSTSFSNEKSQKIFRPLIQIVTTICKKINGKEDLVVFLEHLCSPLMETVFGNFIQFASNDPDLKKEVQNFGFFFFKMW